MQKEDPLSSILKKMQEDLSSSPPSPQTDEDAILRAIEARIGKQRVIDIPAPSGPQITKPIGPIRPKTPEEVERDVVFSDKDRRLLGQFLNSPIKRYEIEASFGTFGSRGQFYPGFKSYPAFHALKSSLNKREKQGKVVKKTLIEVVEVMDNFHARKIIKTKTGDVIWQKKFRPKRDQIESHLWGVRVYKSSESFISEETLKEDMEKAGIEKFVPSLRRIKRRTSYSDYTEESPFHGWRFDLTIVEETHFPPRKYEPVTREEIEIERDSEKATAEGLIQAIKQVLIWSQRVNSFEDVLTLSERKFAVTLHNNLFWYEDKHKSADPYRLYSNYWNKPRNIKIRDLLNAKVQWALTVKLNGTRRFLLLDTEGVYLFGPPYDVIRLGPGVQKFSGTLIDGEFMLDDPKEYHCFDILFLDGENVRRRVFKKRKKFLDKAFEYLKDLKLDTQIRLKKFYTDGTRYERTEDALEEANRLPDERQDGLIFQPDGEYYNKLTLKWKPPEKLTIDLLVIPADPKDPKLVKLMVKDRNRKVPFLGTPRYPLEEIVKLQKTEIVGEPITGRIVEFRWFREHFDPIRIRDDRDQPNNLQTARDVWRDIMDPISRNTIYGDTLRVARRYFNNIKKRLLGSHLKRGATILDIGSGRGGDLQKWSTMGIKKVFAVEPNSENAKELKRRESQMRISTEVQVINAGAEETKKIKKAIKGHKLNGIVAFFSLTFFTKNNELYTSLLETLELLPVGGSFVGIVMDGERTRKLLEEAKEKEIEDASMKRGVSKAEIQEEIKEIEERGAIYQTRAFTIEQLSRFTEQITGNKIEINIQDPGSMVKEQEEWLFYFDPFKEKLGKLGFIYNDQPFRARYVSSNFIDVGDVYSILPESSRVFSSLLRVFSFTKGKKVTSFPKITPALDSTSKLPNSWNENLAIEGVITGPSDILHAVLHAEDSSYRRSIQPIRVQMAEKLRRTLGKTLRLSTFEKLDISKEVTYEEYKEILKDPSVWLSASSILELLSKRLKMNIYVLRGQVKKKKVTSITVSKLTRCYKRWDEAIILYTTDNINYYPVRRMGKVDPKKSPFLFSQKMPFIQKLARIGC